MKLEGTQATPKTCLVDVNEALFAALSHAQQLSCAVHCLLRVEVYAGHVIHDINGVCLCRFHGSVRDNRCRGICNWCWRHSMGSLHVYSKVR